MNRIRNAVLLVLAGALALRVASALVEPILPMLVTFAIMALIFSLLFRRPQ